MPSRKLSQTQTSRRSRSYLGLLFLCHLEGTDQPSSLEHPSSRAKHLAPGQSAKRLINTWPHLLPRRAAGGLALGSGLPFLPLITINSVLTWVPSESLEKSPMVTSWVLSLNGSSDFWLSICLSRIRLNPELNQSLQLLVTISLLP